MQKNTILFDFDFTLADSSRGIFLSANYALQELGFDALDYEIIKKTIGNSLPETFRLLTNINDNEKAGQFVTLFVKKADEVMNKHTFMLEKAKLILPEIKKTGFKTGIVSTKYRYRINGVLQNENLIPFFDIIVGGEDVEKHKPDPEGILLAINKLKVNNQQVIYIGDSLIDAKAALTAKVDFIAVLTGTTTSADFEAFNCKHILPDMAYFSDYLRQNFTLSKQL